MKIFEDGIEEIKKHLIDDDKKEVDSLWKLIVVQRSIKALASFAYLEIDKNRGSYLQYEPTILEFFKSKLFDLHDYPIFNKILKDISK